MSSDYNNSHLPRQLLFCVTSVQNFRERWQAYRNIGALRITGKQRHHKDCYNERSTRRNLKGQANGAHSDEEAARNWGRIKSVAVKSPRTFLH